MEKEDDNSTVSSATLTQVVHFTQDAKNPACYICKRNFCTNRGLLQHVNTCRRKNNTVSNVDVNIIYQSAVVQEGLTQQDRECEKFYWNTVPGNVYQKDLEEACEQIVYWRKMFLWYLLAPLVRGLLLKLRDFLTNGLMTYL